MKPMSISTLLVRRMGEPPVTHQQETPMKITVETLVKAEPGKVWDAWNTPDDIMRWNSPHESWHTTRSTVDLREGGTFVSRMEAKDGNQGFDFGGTYTRVVPGEVIEYRMGDGREATVEFVQESGGVRVRETFDAESENPPEFQQQGWQAILDNFGRYVEARG
jgi:uncharacterized protein YndB with AHSA1/START domain